MRTPAIHPERTAPNRRGASLPTRLAEPLLKGNILDYGAGRGQDAAYLRKKGFLVYPYDPYYFPHPPPRGKQFDWVLLNYVLNVIPSGKERDSVLAHIRDCLKPEGHLLVAVRSRAELARAVGGGWKPYRDGWITGRQTFQRGYTREELRRQLARSGFAVAKHFTPVVAVAERNPGSSALARDAVPFGKKMPQATYYHRSVLERLPPPLQSLVKRGERLLPKPGRWNILKVSTNGTSLSFLWYPGFNVHPHPALRFGYHVDLGDRSVRIMDHRTRKNPFILHRKETLVSPNHPRFKTFRAATRAEEKRGLLSRPDIGTKAGWERALRAETSAT